MQYFDSDVYLSSGFFGAPTFGVSLPGPGFSGAPTFGGSLPGPLPSQDFNDKAKLLMELANCAIEEYNEKECNLKFLSVISLQTILPLFSTNCASPRRLSSTRFCRLRK